MFACELHMTRDWTVINPEVRITIVATIPLLSYENLLSKFYLFYMKWYQNSTIERCVGKEFVRSLKVVLAKKDFPLSPAGGGSATTLGYFRLGVY